MKSRIAKQTQRGVTILAVALATVLLFTACAPTSTSPMEEQRVVELGFMAALTGPAGTASQYALSSVEDYTKYFNEEEGIPGVTVRVAWVNTAFQYDLALSAFNKYVDRGVPIFIDVIVGRTLGPLAERNHLPYITLALASDALYPPGWIYSVYPTEAERFSVYCDWIMENWKEERPPRVAIICADSAWARQIEIPGPKYAESIGIETLPVEIVPYVPLDVVPQLLRISAGGADFAYIASTWVTAVPVVKEAQRLGLLGQLSFAGYENSQSMALLEALGPEAEGYSAPRESPWVEEVEVPGIKLLRDLQMKYRGRLDIQGDEACQLRVSSVACEALKRAVEEVGYENVDGVAVKRALDSIKDFDPYGIGSTTYTSEDHRGSAKVRIYQVQGGEVVPVSDWREAPMLVPEG